MPIGARQCPVAETLGKADGAGPAKPAHDGAAHAQVGAHSPPGPAIVAVVRLAEPPGHVAEGRHDTELPEPRGEGGDSRADDGPVAPATDRQRVPRHGALARISAQCCPALPGTHPLGMQVTQKTVPGTLLPQILHGNTAADTRR